MSQIKKLSEIEHILLRPGMYVGSTKPHTADVWLYENDKFSFREGVQYSPAFLKLFDEVISNAADEHRRHGSIKTIEVVVDQKSGEISISDDGGIPVKKHEEYDEWLPQLIFASFRTGANFNDEEERIVAGTNGYGVKLVNVFSKKFSVRTGDKTNEYYQEWNDNMHKTSAPQIKKSKHKGTTIKWLTDFSRFSMESMSDTDLGLLAKRCIDVAATNPKLKVIFNGKTFQFKNFSEYINLYTQKYFYEENTVWRVGIAASDKGFQSISFVNTVETKDGGTHVDYIINQVTSSLRDLIKKKYKYDIRPTDIKNHLFLFLDCAVVNSAFSSQTKEKLITEVKDFGSKFEISEKIIKQIFTSDIIQSIIEWIEQKQLAEERKALKALNKNLEKVTIVKLIDAQSNQREKCILGIYEGDSALSAFRQYRNPQFHAAFPLRGKFVNVMEMENIEVIKNAEVKNLLASIGLKMGEKPKDLRFGKIYIYADADPDGDSISGLLMNFFAKYWPELFEENRIVRIQTPLLIARTGSGKTLEIINFYTNEDFDNWKSSKSQAELKRWSFSYKKGLAALEDDEYKEIIQNPRGFVLKKDKTFRETFMTWFAGDSQPRKEKLLENSGIVLENVEVKEVKPVENKTKKEKVEKSKKEKPEKPKKEEPSVKTVVEKSKKSEDIEKVLSDFTSTEDKSKIKTRKLF